MRVMFLCLDQLQLVNCLCVWRFLLSFSSKWTINKDYSHRKFHLYIFLVLKSFEFIQPHICFCPSDGSIRQMLTGVHVCPTLQRLHFHLSDMMLV